MNLLFSTMMLLFVAGSYAMPAADGEGEGDIGDGELLETTEMLLPEEDEPEQERKKRDYYYYSSSTSEVQIIERKKPVYTGPIIDYAASGGTGKAPGCLEKYENMPSPNTMCVYQDEPSVYKFGIKKEEIENIVKTHNDYRAAEKAQDMTKMYWDDELAILAQKLAQSCHKGHDLNSERKVPDYNFGIGQNWCGGVKEWSTCMYLWHHEKAKYKYNRKNNAMIGHYTQIVNKKAVAVGCGFAFCPEHFGTNMVCNYAYGQTSGDIKKPYTKGPNCKKCPGKCVDGLCDCGKKLCQNRGTLNLSTCECDCKQPYKGELCDEPDCSKNDIKSCGKGLYVKKNCQKFANLPGMCRYECGVCS